MAKTKNDNTQVEQSKKWIGESLLALMEEMPYEKITIKEIAENADLDRRTFYRHFKSKEEVLDEHLLSIVQPHLEALANAEIESEFEMTVRNFTFLHQHLALLRLLKRQNLFGYLLRRYPDFVGLFNEMQGADISESNGENVRFKVAFKTGAFWHVVLQWMEDDPAKPPEEIAAIIQGYFENGAATRCSLSRNGD